MLGLYHVCNYDGVRMNAYSKQINNSFIEAIECIDAKTYRGYAIEHPELVAAWIQAAALAAGFDELTAAFSHLEGLEQQLLDIATSIRTAGK